jgi:cyclic-di-AMP phosphodiesterase PgpH
VGALYHDVGKIPNRGAFIENQQSANPHDALTPAESADLIRRHVPDGVAMVRANRLGERIADFVREHHGTRSIEYFLDKARRSGQPFAAGDYQYPGPRPQSKETAILMIADQVEATSRTMSQAGEEQYRAAIESTLERLRTEGQLAESPLTLSDLEGISHAVVRVLVGMHHHRVEYPTAAPDVADR